MLVGRYLYNGFWYTINAYDYGDAIVANIISDLNKGCKEIDKGIEFSNGDVKGPFWDSLYVSISTGSITVQQAMEIDEDTGKKVKSRLNDDFFSMLGTIISGMRAGVRSELLADNDDLFDTGFNPMKSHTYMYDSDCTITLELGIIQDLHFVGEDGTELHLEEDGSFDEKIFYEGNKKKIKLDLSSFLGDTSMDDDLDDWDFGDDEKIFSLSEIIEKNPNKDYLWLKDRKYEIIKSTERLEEVCKMIWQHKGKVAFDTETSGLNITIKSREGKADTLVGMVFSIEPGYAYYFPVKHKKISNICTEGNKAFILEKYFKPILEKKEIICHNGAFDWKVMYIFNICVNLVDDTYILFKVTMWNDHTNLELGLKKLVKTFLGRDSFELSDFVKGKFNSDKVKFWDLEEESVKYYACPDTDSLLDLYNYTQTEDLLGKYKAKKIYEIEVLFSVVIAYQEFYGHCVDVDDLPALREAIERDLSENYKKMVEIVGHDFNPKSAPQKAKIMFEELKMPILDLTDTGNPSTGKDTLKKLMGYKDKDGNLLYPFVKYLKEWNDASILKTNFVNNIDKFATEDGIMFSSVQQFLATGRVSTSDPNYQGYSDTVKHYIVPRTGYWAMDADYSSVEARIMCSMAGCKNMVEKMKDPDTDYHRQKASDMFQVAYELVTEALRKMSKGVNFGILYGLGDPNLGANLYGSVSPENTRKASHMKELYFVGMEELRGFIEISKKQGIEEGFSTTFFGRRRYYDIRKTNKGTIGRQSCNARIQGTAADIYKVAMIRLFSEIKKKGWLGKVLISAFVHDECYLEVHKSINPAVMLKVLKNCMMLEIEGWCPLFIGAGYGANWYEAKHNEIPVQVQETICENWGDTGFEWWSGDVEYLKEYINNTILNYKKDRVLVYIKDENNWNTVFKPTENELCHSLLKDIKNGEKVEGIVNSGCEITGDMLEDLREFCRIFDCLDIYEKAGIQKPEHKEEEESENNDFENFESNNNSFENEIKQSFEEILEMRINSFGVYLDRSSGINKIYIKYDENDQVLLGLVSNVIERNEGNIPVYAVKGDNSIYETSLTTNVKAVPELLKIYMTSINMSR